MSLLKCCLLEAVKLTKNTDFDKYSYSGYSVRFNSLSLFLSQILILFDNISSMHIANRIKILGKGATQELNDTAAKSQANYFNNSTASKNKFC